MTNSYEGSGSHSADPQDWQNTDVFKSIEDAGGNAQCWLECLEKQVAQEVSNNLEQFRYGIFQGSDDDVFQPFNWYVIFCCDRLIPQRSIALWLNELAKNTQMVEAKARKRVHKGAPLYNVGLAFFCAGDFDHALTFIAEAGREDEASGRAPADRVLIGDNELSSKILVDPLCAWLSSANVWGTAYNNLTGITLSKSEYTGVLNWASGRLTDALQIVVSLQRFAALQVTPDNPASRHLRMQALADLVLVVESSMRYWQRQVQGQLDQRMRAMLACNATAAAAYEATRVRFDGQFHGQMESIQALNWLIDDCLRGVNGAGTRAERMGIASYLVVRLRNNLMHVIDDTINLYSDLDKLLAISALVFSVIRVSKFGDELSLAGL